MTHVGTTNSCRWPLATSARVMTPMVFCASLAPWLNETKAAERTCAPRKVRLSGPGAQARRSQYRASITRKPITSPARGESRPGSTTLWMMPWPWTKAGPWATSMAPIKPPMRACEEELGKPRRHVIRFHAMAPTRAAPTRVSVTLSVCTMPLPTVAATFVVRNAPARLSTAESRTAVRGLSARVETEVAMALAVSWKPLVKSNVSATAIMRKMARSLGIFQHHILQRVAHILTLVKGPLHQVVEPVPLDHLERRVRIRSKEIGERVVVQIVGLGLQPVHLGHVGAEPFEGLQLADSGHQLVDGAPEERTCFQEVGAGLLDAVEHEHDGNLVDLVEHRIDDAAQHNQIFTLKGRDERAVEQGEDLARNAITLVFDLVHALGLPLEIAIVAQHGTQDVDAGLARGDILPKQVKERAFLWD